MPTPSIQTLVTDAQQVLNLDSISAVRSVVAVALANANTGTPLNPNLTTQQLWNEFYQVVTKPKSDIESIIANQLMKFLYAPPAPGGVGANGQVIFNDNGVLAGDAGLTYNKATDALTITGDLTVDTNVLKVDSTLNRVGIGTASPGSSLEVAGSIRATGSNGSATASIGVFDYVAGTTTRLVSYGANTTTPGAFQLVGFSSNASAGDIRLTIDSSGNLGLGVTPTAGAGVLQLSSGINFPATQVASANANTLDDYEEGTWTGTLKGSVSDPTTPVTASGRYTKIGRQVFVEITYNNVNTTGASGGMSIAGLPFTCNVFTNGLGVVSLGGAGTYTGDPFVFLNVNTSNLEFYADVSAASANAITHNASAGKYINASMTYTV